MELAAMEEQKKSREVQKTQSKFNNVSEIKMKNVNSITDQSQRIQQLVMTISVELLQ